MSDTDKKSAEFIPVAIAILTISDRRTMENDDSGDLLVKEIESFGHLLEDRKLCKDDRYQIRSILSDWIANDENEYVKKAIEFSANLKQLSEIKKNLRKTALESPAFNASLFAEQLNTAVWKMWNNYIIKM